MPRVPSYGGLQVAPTVQPSGSLEPVSPSGDKIAFNGIQSMQSAAAGLSDEAQKYFEQANQTRVQEAINALDADVFDQMYGQEGMMNRRGKAVVDTGTNESFTQEGMGRFDKAVTRYAEGLTPIQRKLYEEKIGARRLAAEKDFTRHEAQQYNAYAIETESVRAARATDNLAMRGYDPEYLQSSVSEIRSAYHKLGELQGWGEEKTKYEADKAVSSAITGVIRGHLANGNTEAALSMFRLGEKGLIRGADAVSLRTAIEKVAKQQTIDIAAKQVAYDVRTSHDIMYRFADQLMKTDHTSPELEKDLTKAQSDRERRDAYAREADRLLVKAGGDARVACQIAYMGERVLEAGVSVHSGDADAMYASIATAPDIGTEMTEEDLQRQVYKLYPNLPVTEKMEIAKKAKAELVDYTLAIDSSRAKKIEELQQAIKANPAVTIDDASWGDLTASQRKNVLMYQENLRNNPSYFTGRTGELRNAYRLMTISNSDFASELLLVDPNEHQALRRLREQLKSGTVKPGDTDERDVLSVWKDELRFRGSSLLEKDNKLEEELAFRAFRMQVEKATKEKGGIPLTHDEIRAQMAMFKVPQALNPRGHALMDTEEQLDASASGKKALSRAAERLGFGTSTMSLFNLAQRLEYNDPTLPQVGLGGLRLAVGDKAYDYLIDKYGVNKVSTNTNACLLEAITAMYDGQDLSVDYEQINDSFVAYKDND